jgi:hypothetical protein
VALLHAAPAYAFAPAHRGMLHACAPACRGTPEHLHRGTPPTRPPARAQTSDQWWSKSSGVCWIPGDSANNYPVGIPYSDVCGGTGGVIKEGVSAPSAGLAAGRPRCPAARCVALHAHNRAPGVRGLRDGADWGACALVPACIHLERSPHRLPHPQLYDADRRRRYGDIYVFKVRGCTGGFGALGGRGAGGGRNVVCVCVGLVVCGGFG